MYMHRMNDSHSSDYGLLSITTYPTAVMSSMEVFSEGSSGPRGGAPRDRTQVEDASQRYGAPLGMLKCLDHASSL